MKYPGFALTLTLLLTGLFLNCRADYSSELLKLIRIDQLAQYNSNVKTRQVSSYDTTHGNDDGFSGKYSFLREENGTQVIAELKGPGIIHRIWTPTPKDEIIQFYFDGEEKPRIEMKFIDLFSGEQYPFIRPVVGNEVGGYYCYLPVPYEKSCKIVFHGKMQFIQIQYSELDLGNPVQTFPVQLSGKERETLREVAELWGKSGRNILEWVNRNKGELKTLSRKITLRPGETLPIFKLNKGGRIAGIEITPGVKLNGAFKDLIIRAHWDNDAAPAINCPVTDFFGYAFGKPAARSLLLGVREDTHYSYFPMPFDHKAKLELEFLRTPRNNSAEIPLNIRIFYTENPRHSDEGKFYAEWRREKNPELGQPYRILKKTGRGHQVGTFLQAQGLRSGMTIFFEGDDQCTIDGELRLHGTGSEDYFNGGWYALADRWDQGYNLPLHGCLDYSIPLARTGGYRLMVTDKVSFEKELLLTIEHGPENNNVPVDYVSVAFYYCDTPPETNPLPSEEQLSALETPSTLEYWLQLLPVKALSHGVSLSTTDYKADDSGRGYQVYKLEGQPGGFAKFELEVPREGIYKLYLSYLKGPDCGNFEVYQRQIPIKKGISGFSSQTTFVDREYIGDLKIEKGTNTITVILKEKPSPNDKNIFLLHRAYLEM